MADLSLPSDAFHLGDLLVVPSLNRLIHEGESIDIEPRMMRVLARLAEAPGEVVTRADLFETVWAGTVVNDEALTRAVSELRKVLSVGAPDAIETIRGTGYRLARPIWPLASEGSTSVVRPSDAAHPTRGGFLVVLALGLAGVALLVALWAAWPREAPEASGEHAGEILPPLTSDSLPRLNREVHPSADAPTRLDSTSPFYRPGLSELGVYYDSTTGRYFRFSDD